MHQKSPENVWQGSPELKLASLAMVPRAIRSIYGERQGVHRFMFVFLVACHVCVLGRWVAVFCGRQV